MKYDVDPSLATAIVSCESNFDPLAVMHNKNGTEDRGLAQINSTHWEFFKSIGLDVAHDPIDNLEGEFYLLKHNGTRDYRFSEYCWRPKLDMGIYDAIGSTTPRNMAFDY